jgi:hypothetical protein
VAADEHLLAELSDPDGRAVVLPERIWEDKIIKDHPELRAHLEHVLGTVTKPDHAELTPERGGAATTDAGSAPAGGCSWS